MTDKAFVVLSHYLNPRIRALIDRARRELDGTHDVHLLGFFPDSGAVPREVAEHPLAQCCTIADLRHLGYPGVAETPDYRIIPGDADMVVLWFARQHPQYREIWLFEGDVDFTGAISDLVQHLDKSRADLLLTWLEQATPDWPLFRKARVPEGWPEPRKVGIRAFLPVFRVSRQFLDALAMFYANGGRGHYEWVWPQVAMKCGMECRDIADFPFNGRPLYSNWPRIGRRSLGTFRYRPAMAAPGRRRNTLWHPVKDRPINLLDEWARPLLQLVSERAWRRRA